MENQLYFKIDPQKPKNLYYSGEIIIKLSEAIASIFSAHSSKAILFWGEEEIPLSYSNDISIMIDDILQMLFTLQNSNAGEWSVDWPSYRFSSNWHLIWKDDFLEITAQWREEFNPSDYLKKNNVIKFKKSSFIEEWKNLLNVLHEHLSECYYDDKNLMDMKLFYNIIDWSKQNN